MSRHDFEQTDPVTSIDYEITVGWDRPMQTYFAQVYAFEKGASSAPEPILWIGTGFCEHPEPENVIDAVRPYLTIPDNLHTILRADREATRNQKDGPAQMYMKNLLRP